MYILKCKHISQYYCLYCIFDKKNLLTQNIWMVVFETLKKFDSNMIL